MNKTASAIKNPINIEDSMLPPVLNSPAELLLHGQNGIIPSCVKLSANKCREYPKKKGNAIIGRTKASATDTKTQNVMLCNTPLCLAKNCRGLKMLLCPRLELGESMSGNKDANRTTGKNASL